MAEVFDWDGAGDVEVAAGEADQMTFHMSEASAAHFHSLTSLLGAMLTGARTFEVADGRRGHHGWGPAFVLTRTVPDGRLRPGSTVHSVTDGMRSAVDQAEEAAAEKDVAVHGAETAQQLLNAELVDELCIDLAAVLLGSGVRLFDPGTPGRRK